MGSHDMYSSLISFAQYCSCRRYHDDVTVNCWTAFHHMSKSQFIHLIIEGIWIFTVGPSTNKAARDIMYISWWRLHTFLLYLSVQFSHSAISDSAPPWTAAAAHQASLSITNSWSLLKFMSIELVMPSNHLILCCPLLLLPSIFPSIRVFSNKSVLRIRWLKYWRNFSFSISPFNEYSELISFRMDWLDLPAVQGTMSSSNCCFLTCTQIS